MTGRLGGDEGGVATIEFALLSVLFFAVISAVLDIGLWFQQRLRIDAAVEQGAMIAFNSRMSVDADAIRSFVASAAKLSAAPTVTVGCNGGTTPASCVNGGRSYVCLSGAGSAAVYAPSAGGLDQPCPGGGLSGYYMTIRAVATAGTIVVPASLLGSMTQTRTAVVRLE
jgi:Flp pilus assembly protein TadG